MSSPELKNIKLDDEVYKMLFNIRIYNVGKVEELTEKISEFLQILFLDLFFNPENVEGIDEKVIQDLSKHYSEAFM